MHSLEQVRVDGQHRLNLSGRIRGEHAETSHWQLIQSVGVGSEQLAGLRRAAICADEHRSRGRRAILKFCRDTGIAANKIHEALAPLDFSSTSPGNGARGFVTNLHWEIAQHCGAEFIPSDSKPLAWRQPEAYRPVACIEGEHAARLWPRGRGIDLGGMDQWENVLGEE